MAKRDNNQDKHIDAIIGGILIGISVLLMLILFGVFDPAGKYVKDFLIGVFGLSFYGISVAMFIIGVLKLMRFRLSAPITRILEVVGIYSLFILAFHATSYDYMTMTSSFGEYITMCFESADTAGGVIGAVVMYPLMLVNKVFAIVIVALLLFALIAVAMFGGRVSLHSMRTRSVKYDKKEKKEKATHIEVDNDLKNETIDGKQLGDIKTRSRFSKAQTEYLPIEEDDIEEISDEEFQVNYKDKYAYDSNTANNEEIMLDKHKEDDDNQPNGENKFERMRRDAKIAREKLYGPDNNNMSETHIADSENTAMTDQEKFKEAIERIRNNEDQSYISKFSTNKDDYELYSIEARERIFRENMERERREKEEEAEKNLSNNNQSFDFNVDDIKLEDNGDNYQFDNFNAFNDDDSNKTHEEDLLADDSEIVEGIDANKSIISDDIRDTSVNGEEESTVQDNDDTAESKDESVTYDIDDFSSSLDKTFEIKKNEESKYDMPYYSRDEMYMADKNVDKKDVKPSNPKDRVDNIEKELLEEEQTNKDKKRRSDFGGTHQSQRPLDKPEQKNKLSSGDMSGFINPFASKAKEEKVEEPIVEEVEEKHAYVSKLGYKYQAPPISMLAEYEFTADDNDKEIAEQCARVEESLQNFGIYATVTNVVKGPTFSRIELEMDRGMGKSVKSVKNLQSDIEMWLGCNGHINIQAPIPGKSAIGIEVPNTNRRTVGLKEVFNSELFNSKKWKIPFALGVDIDNKSHVCDITKSPHLLIAGSTGSGKSVGIACLLNSILYKCSPDEVKLILVDPKKVELNDYQGLPHMLIKNPITDPHQVMNALNWLIEEMERRYDALCEVHTSNIGEYNEYADEHNEARMPYILLVIDEVADLMMVLKKNLEEKINRLAAKSRAAGIHIVLATQRPSVDIITGTIKSNLPSRIAFATVQAEDSKTILGSIGAEKLLRYGDMLYMDSASPVLNRIQGAFISKKEVIAITNYVREHNPAEFDDSIQEYVDREEGQDDENEHQSHQDVAKPSDELPVDDLFKPALEIFIEANKATASLLQRKLGIGYPRAAKIVDQLTECGFVSGKNVLINHMQFMNMFGNDDNGEE